MVAVTSWVDWQVCDCEQVTVGRRLVDAIRTTDGEQFTVGSASRTMCKWATTADNSSSRETACPTFLANVNVSSRSLYAVARPSVVCLSSVTLVHPTQPVEILAIFGTLATLSHPQKTLRRSSHWTPPLGELNTTGVAKYSDFGPIEGYISETVQHRRKVSINHW